MVKANEDFGFDKLTRNSWLLATSSSGIQMSPNFHDGYVLVTVFYVFVGLFH